MSLSLKLCFIISLIYLCQYVQSTPRRKSKCNELVNTTTGYIRLTHCCNGYKPVTIGTSKSIRCKPHCSAGCIDGICISPDNCQCHDGFAKDPVTSRCIPSCSPPCYNGDCVGGDTCQCWKGFRAFNDTHCEPGSPQCSPSCINGVCIGPNKCRCHDNYKLSGWVQNGFDYTCLPQTTTSTTTTLSDDYEETETISSGTDQDQVVTEAEVFTETSTEVELATEDVTEETSVTEESMTKTFGEITEDSYSSRNDEVAKNSGTKVWIYISAAILVAVVTLLMVAYRWLLGYVKGKTYVVQDQTSRRASASSRTFNVTFSSNPNGK